jgi:hypothetical protein
VLQEYSLITSVPSPTSQNLVPSGLNHNDPGVVSSGSKSGEEETYNAETRFHGILNL